MPEVHSQSVNNPHCSPTPNRTRRHRRIGTRKRSLLASGRIARRHLYRQLTKIQINTAGLSGPYRTDEETMERVTGNHSAVRELRRLLRRSVLVPRSGLLWDLLLSASLTACAGDARKAARLLGASVQQLGRSATTVPESSVRSQ